MTDAIALGERILQLLDQGSFTSTYKYAVLLGLLDLCLEETRPDGAPPSEFTTRQLAERVIELYWSHTRPYPDLPHGPEVLRQNRSRRGTQAEILRRIERFRLVRLGDPDLPLALARIRARGAFEQLLDFVEWKLIQMPLPRLQTIGGKPDPFLYEIAWTADSVRRRPVADYQTGRAIDFDNRIRLAPGVAEQLVALNGLLRPLIHRQWAQDVARINRLPEATLQAFLFGSARTPTRTVRKGLVEIQDGKCFYCERPIRVGTRIEIDHFIPWSRHPDDSIQNLVAADHACNRDKHSHLAATPHVQRWLDRLSGPTGHALAEIAGKADWESDRDRTLGVATSIYLRIPDDMGLWIARGRFETPERETLRRAFLEAG